LTRAKFNLVNKPKKKFGRPKKLSPRRAARKIRKWKRKRSCCLKSRKRKPAKRLNGRHFPSKKNSTSRTKILIRCHSLSFKKGQSNMILKRLTSTSSKLIFKRAI
jgi:hypothetical protein